MRIPTSRDLDRQSTRSGRISPNAPQSGIGQALAGAGQDVVKAAFDLNALAEREQNDVLKSKSNDVSTSMQNFLNGEEQRFNEARDKASGSGIGFTRQYLEGWKTRADEFAKTNFEGLNEDQQTAYTNQLLSRGNALYSKADSFEGSRKQNYYTMSTNESLDGIRKQIRSNSAPFDDLKRAGIEQINSIPDADEQWKLARIKDWEQDALESQIEFDIETDPEKAVDEIRGGVVDTKGIAGGIQSSAAALGISPNDLATVISYETGGTFNPTKAGPVTQHGRHRGLIQFGEEQARTNGVDWNDPVNSQLGDNGAVVKYLRAAGVKPGMGLLDIYSAINAGSVGRYNASDANNGGAPGTVRDKVEQQMEGHKQKAASLLGGTYTPKYANLSYARQETFLNRAEAAYNKQQNEQAAVARFEIDTATTNAPAAIMNTGTYTGVMPQQEQFIQAYGPDMGARKYNELMTAVQTSTQAFSMQTMPESEIQQMVKQSAPTSTGENAKLENDRYETLQAAAQQTIKAREADPSTYVQQAFPHVAETWKNAGVDGDYQSALSITAAAQQQLGIKNMQLMPKQLATDTVNRFKDASLPGDERINAITGLVFSSKDQGQRQAVYQQLVSAGLPDTTEGAIEAYARGDQGAGRRLMEAAIIDPGKLPGTAPFKPSEIDAAIQSQIMDEGQLGDIAYGLTDGSVENQEKAIRDAKLLTNAVNIRVRNGEALETAVSSAAKDLFGDVQPVTGNGQVNAQIIIPTGENPEKVLNGLESFLPTVRSTIETSMSASTSADQSEAVRSTGGAKIIDAVTSNYIENVMAEGYFRNAGNGYVFMDPYVGAAVSGPDGKPMIFTPDQVAAAPVKAKVDPIAEADNAASMRRVQSQQEVNQSEYGKFADMLDQAPGDQPEAPARSFNPGPINGGR